MINVKNILNIAKKEILGFLDNPASYLVIIVFSVLWQFLFFRNAFLVGEASLRSLYDILPWLLLILIPAITMGSIAREKDEGTLEFILTRPIRDLEFVFGKFLGALFYVVSALLFTIPLAFSFAKYGKLDWGVYLGQFVGSILFSVAFISLGIFISSLLRNQIASLLTTAGAGFLFIIIGSEFFTAGVPLEFAPVFERLSLVSHASSMSRGVLDLRDVWYFLSFSAVFLSLSYLLFLSRKYGNKKKTYANYQMMVGLFVGITVLTNIIGDRIPGRIDLTMGRLYTLSASTKKTLADLDDLVTITLYASSKLPAQYTPILRDVKDTLVDYKNASHGAIQLSLIDPAKDAETTKKAMAAGIVPVQFNVVNQEEFQVKQGYLGISVSYAGKSEAIPFVQGTADLEYQLTSLLKKLTDKNKKQVAFLMGHDEKSVYKDYAALYSELSKQFKVTTYTLEKDKGAVDPSIDTLIIAGPKRLFEDWETAILQKFIKEDKSVLFLLDSVQINMASLEVTETPATLLPMLSDLGVEVNKDVAYDLRAGETIRFNDGTANYLLPYPFWLHSVSKKIDNVSIKQADVSFPWPSSITVSSEKLTKAGFESSVLLSTTTSGGSVVNVPSVRPNLPLADKNLREFTLGVLVNFLGSKGKFVVVGDSDFLSNDHLQNNSSNLSFGQNLVEYLSNSDSLSDIRIKSLSPERLAFTDKAQPTNIKYINISIALMVPVALGAWRILRRRGVREKVYA